MPVTAERDSRGRFIKGNQIAKGNRGNRKPKWGNKNAVTTGEYERIDFMYVGEDGWLYIYQTGIGGMKINPKCFYPIEGGYNVLKGVAAELQELGFRFNRKNYRGKRK